MTRANQQSNFMPGRRRFLRGCSVALALPWMESLAFKAAAAATANRPPVRTGFIYFPNGVWEKAWVPQSTGTEYELSPSLRPLEQVKSDVLVLSGLDKQNSHGGDGHYAKTANFLTGMPVTKTTGRDISSGGISVDQLIAERLAGQTPLPSLELGTEPVISGIDSNVGYTRLYGSHISWQSANRPVAKEINPRVVYERLFGRAQASAASSVDSPESYSNLLDFVLEDARSLRGRLGRDDQFKMDEYLDSVRGVEQRIEFATKHDQREAWQASLSPEEVAVARPGVPGNFREHISIMMDLMVLAFQSDSTRVCSFMFANDVSGRNFSFLDGVSGGHHELSHHENNDTKISQYQRINEWHTEQFARMLSKMKSIPEGEGTLLDNSMIVFGSSMSDGNRHDPDNLPILVGGRGGGTLHSGQHIAVEGMVPLCNLYLTMLHKLGIEIEQFGDSNNVITGI
jgi:hypothetical protein